MNLTDAVQAALARLAVPGIEGWGLNNPVPGCLEEAQIGPVTGCDSDTCRHNSHGWASATYRLIPREGFALSLIAEDRGDETAWYALRGPDVEHILRIRTPRHFHADANVVDPASVPDYLLAALV